MSVTEPDASSEAAYNVDRSVAIIAPGEVFGGAERQLLYLMTYLKRERYRCLLICFHDNDFADRARAVGVATCVLPARPHIRWSNARKIAALLRSEGIRIVHVNGYKATAHALLARTLARFHVVKTEHGRPEVSSRFAIADLKPRLFRAVENLAAGLLGAHLVYVTEELRASCSKEHARLAASVILNGIDFAGTAEEARPPELDASTWNAVVVGRLEPVKGIEFAIRAIADAKVPRRVRLWIVGDGPLKGALQELAVSLGAADRVRFTGFRRDAVAFIAHADALMMPSLHEGLPYTLLEAVVARTPVIASNVGGLAEVLSDGQTALLAPPGDAEMLARSIARMAADPDGAGKLAAAAYTALAARHSVERMGAAYVSLYAALARLAAAENPASR